METFLVFVLFVAFMAVLICFQTEFGAKTVEKLVNLIFFGRFKESGRVDNAEQVNTNPLLGARATVVKEFVQNSKNKWTGRISVNGTNWNAVYEGSEKPEAGVVYYVSCVNGLILTITNNKLTSL